MIGRMFFNVSRVICERVAERYTSKVLTLSFFKNKSSHRKIAIMSRPKVLITRVDVAEKGINLLKNE